jgi:hypothetical protein
MSTFVYWFLADLQKTLRNRYIFDFDDPQLDARVRRNAARILAGEYTGNDNGL